MFCTLDKKLSKSNYPQKRSQAIILDGPVDVSIECPVKKNKKVCSYDIRSFPSCRVTAAFQHLQYITSPSSLAPRTTSRIVCGGVTSNKTSGNRTSCDVTTNGMVVKARTYGCKRRLDVHGR